LPVDGNYLIASEMLRPSSRILYFEGNSRCTGYREKHSSSLLLSLSQVTLINPRTADVMKFERTADAGCQMRQEWYCFETFEKQFFYYNISCFC